MCEGSLQKDKEKTQIYGVMMMRCGIKEQKMEKMIEWKRKDEEIRDAYEVRKDGKRVEIKEAYGENGEDDHAT